MGFSSSVRGIHIRFQTEMNMRDCVEDKLNNRDKKKEQTNKNVFKMIRS